MSWALDRYLDGNTQKISESSPPSSHQKRRFETDSKEFQSRKKISSPQILSIDPGSGDNFRTSDISGDSESKLPESRGESASEVDWEAFLYDEQMLPSSNWEAEFLKHEAVMLDNYSYKALIYSDEESRLGYCDDDPWYPHDPERVLRAGCESEVAATSEIDGSVIICYGIVSFMRFIFKSRSKDLSLTMPTDP